jgi:hypothetical protein
MRGAGPAGWALPPLPAAASAGAPASHATNTSKGNTHEPVYCMTNSFLSIPDYVQETCAPSRDSVSIERIGSSRHRPISESDSKFEAGARSSLRGGGSGAAI